MKSVPRGGARTHAPRAWRIYAGLWPRHIMRTTCPSGSPTTAHSSQPRAAVAPTGCPALPKLVRAQQSGLSGQSFLGYYITGGGADLRDVEVGLLNYTWIGRSWPSHGAQDAPALAARRLAEPWEGVNDRRSPPACASASVLTWYGLIYVYNVPGARVSATNTPV